MGSWFEFSFTTNLYLGIFGDVPCGIRARVYVDGDSVSCDPMSLNVWRKNPELDLNEFVNEQSRSALCLKVEDEALKNLNQFQSPMEVTVGTVTTTQCILQNNSGIWQQLVTNGHKSVGVALVESGSQHVAVYLASPAINIITGLVHTDHVTALAGKSGNQYTMTLDKMVIKFSKPGPDGTRVAATTADMIGAKLTVYVAYEIA
jgi:hypothetical protein